MGDSFFFGWLDDYEKIIQVTSVKKKLNSKICNFVRV